MVRLGHDGLNDVLDVLCGLVLLEDPDVVDLGEDVVVDGLLLLALPPGAAQQTPDVDRPVSIPLVQGRGRGGKGLVNQPGRNDKLDLAAKAV